MLRRSRCVQIILSGMYSHLVEKLASTVQPNGILMKKNARDLRIFFSYNTSTVHSEMSSLKNRREKKHQPTLYKRFAITNSSTGGIRCRAGGI